LTASTQFTVTGSGTTTVTENLTTTATLSNMVYKAAPTFNWYLICGNGTNSIGSSAHTLYVAYGPPQPAGSLTVKRIDWVCTLAAGASSPAAIGDLVGPDATGGARFGANSIFGSPPTLTTAWQVMDGYKADCGTLSTLMKYELDLLGASGSAVNFVYSCHADWSHLSSASSTANETDGSGDILIMWFGSAGLGAGYNNYEGCCVFQSKWWEGGNGRGAASAYQVNQDSTLPNTSGTATSHQAWNNATATAVAYPPGVP
jgi:hypothetical protein